MSPKPAFVIVPGAWHAPACFEPTTSVLKSKYGYSTTTVELPSVGSELRGLPPPQNWDQDVAAVREAISSHLNEGHDVVLVAHSYGGCPASEAAKGLDKWSRGDKPGIIRLVWIASFALRIGGWMWERTGGKPSLPSKLIMDGDLCHVRPEEANEWFYGACSPSDQDTARKHLRSLAWKVFTNSKVTYQAWQDIPATYLMCDNDNAIPVGFQETMLDVEKDRWHVERCDADHSPFISRVDFTVEVLRRAAGEDLEGVSRRVL